MVQNAHLKFNLVYKGMSHSEFSLYFKSLAIARGYCYENIGTFS